MIKFIHPWNGNNAGQKKKFDDDEEQRLIRCGLAVLESKNEPLTKQQKQDKKQ